MTTAAEKPDRILIIRLSALGDIVFGLPVLEVLARDLPGVELHWLCEEKTVQLLAGHPLIARLHIFPRRALRQDWRRPWLWWRGVLRLLRYLHALRRERYDAVLDLQGNAKSALQVLFTRARRKIGFARGGSKEGAWRVLTEQVDPGPAETHRIDKDLRLVEPLGLERRFLRPQLPPRPTAANEAEALWSQVPGSGPKLVIHPGSSAYNAYKRWPAERYGKAIATLRESLDARCVLIEGRGEGELIETIHAAAGAMVSVFPEDRDLLQAAALIRRADLFLGGDSAPLHLAHCQGIPCVGIYGPKSPAVYGPYGVPHRILLDRTPCHPCRLRSCSVPLCILGIQPEAVTGAVLSLWEEVGDRG